MDYETINTHVAVGLFCDLMRATNEMRILRLVGDGKMGKSHLLTKVFPALAQRDYQARYATLDLRNKLLDVPDILQQAGRGIGMENCHSYNSSAQAWIERSRNGSKVELKGIRSFLSVFRITLHENRSDIYYRNNDLTNSFVNDIAKLTDKPLLLLFDSVNNAEENLQVWLMDSLLVQLSRFNHVKVVVAGRTLPEVHGSYAIYCGNYQLRPITEIEEYITYCRKLNKTLEEQSIRDFAIACDYIPGTFAELIFPKFVKLEGPSHV